MNHQDMPQLTHMAIYVTDLDRMASFYQKLLGLAISDRGRGTAFPADFIFFTADPEKHHQFVLVTGRAAGGPSTVNQISFKLRSLAQLKALTARARECGSPSITPLNHGNALSVYVKDPEDNMVELYIDTPWYVNQPFSRPWDPTASDEAIWAETEQLARQQPSFMTREAWMAEVASKIQAQLSQP